MKNSSAGSRSASFIALEPAAWEPIANPDDYSPERVRNGMVVGTPEQMVAKLQQYAAVGVDQFCYGASFALPHDVAMRSLELFITELMPHTSEQDEAKQ